MAAKFLKFERHVNDELTKDLYLIWLDNPGAVDAFVRRFFMLNRIEFDLKKKQWAFRPRPRLQRRKDHERQRGAR